jgi:surface carbohydrate biosynthesis protein
MKVIYIHIEITKREYLSKILLSFFAARLGFTVIMGDILYLFSKMRKLKDREGIFHFKDIAPSELNLSLFKRLKKNNFIITSIDEEGGIEYKDYDKDVVNSFLADRYSEETIELVDAIFSWGDFDYNSLIKNFPKFKNKFYNTGNPRLDFCKKELEIFFENNDTNKLNEEKKPILIISDIGNIMSSKSLSDQVSINRKAAELTNNIDKKENQQFEIYSNKVIYLGEYVNLIKKLVKNFPNEKFILRPHPTERKEDWINILGDYNNLNITKEKSVTSWIRNCKIMIHGSCYTALEAAILKKPVISFCPKKCEEYKKFFTGKIGLPSENFNDLKSHLLNFDTNSDYFNKNIEDNYSLVSERLNIKSISAKEQVDIWNDLSKKNFQEKSKAIYNPNFLLISFMKINYLVKSFFKFFLKYLGFQPNLHSKFEELNKKKVKNELETLEKTFYKGKHKFSVNKFNKNLCLIKIKD